MSATSPMPPSTAADAVLQGLDAEQRDVAAHPSGAMCVLAGAGTGKTRAITHRIAYGVHAGVYVPQRVLAVTFTARAAGEMRTRLRRLSVAGVQARTFHAAALRQLHYFWPQAVGGASPEVLSQKVPVLAEAAGRLRMRFERTELRDLAAEVEWSKVSLLTPETYAGGVRAARRQPPGIDATGMARLLEAYEEVKHERGVIDFEDVLLLTVGILEDREDVAATVRRQYRHFVVDEYQDVNELQQRLLDLWVGGREDVCVVGDPAQTIYSFTGASPRHLLEFEQRHPGARVVRLVRNYRSTPQVVSLANNVVRGPSGALRGGAVRLEAQRAGGPEPELEVYDDDVAEANGVAASIAAAVANGRPAGEVAVLFRTNGQSEVLESALAEQGVPYLVRGGERFFARSEVRNAIVLLRGAARSDDGSVPLPDLVRDILVTSGWSRETPRSGGATRERWESLAALASLADDLASAQPDARLPQLVADLDERAAAQHAPSVAGVTLASLHAAKGLEWPVVFLVGCSEGLLPVIMADTPEAVEEERRLLYVGMTRACDELHLSWARSRTPGGRATRRVSRFLEGSAILGAAAAPATRASGRRARRSRPSTPVRCRECGTELTSAAQRTTGRCDGCPPSYDEALFERLRAWRLAVSRAAGVPAYVVFTDATLTAIAERVPSGEAELSMIHGVGARKLGLYGAQVLEVLAGAQPDEVIAAHSTDP